MGIFDRFFGPPTEEQFAKIMIAALRRHGQPGEATYEKSEFRLQFVKDGKPGFTFNLRNLFTEYCSLARKDRATWLARTCSGLQNQMDLPEDFEDAKPDLLPSVRPKSMLEVMRIDIELSGREWSELAVLPLSEDLVVCLIYDLPTSIRFVLQDQLDQWGVSIYEAAEVAKQNLEERDGSYLSIGDKLFSFVAGDAFDASRMLLLDRIRALKVAGDPVAMPVTRETLLVTGSDDEEGLSMMARFAEAQKDDARPLCSIPHRLMGDEWQAWQPPPSSASYEAMRTLALRYWYSSYSEQQQQFEKLHERSGADVFVASFAIAERDEKDVSFCTWTKGVKSWLPKTDFVGLYDPETQTCRFVAWAQLLRKVGSMLTSLECYPPRWQVNDFPSEAQFEQLQFEIWQKQS